MVDSKSILSRKALRAVVMHWIGIGCLAGCSSSTSGRDLSRPAQYPEAWGQFDIESWADTRTVTIFRLGAGSARPAECSVFEMTADGAELRWLWGATLKTPFAPWVLASVGHGRFLVTMDDRWVEGRIEEVDQATTDNCLVFYDFLLCRSTAWRAKDFLPQGYVGNWHSDFKWDFLRRQFYVDVHARPSANSAARRSPTLLILDPLSCAIRLDNGSLDGLPFGAADHLIPNDLGRVALLWEWSCKDSAEPAWGAKNALPLMIRAVPNTMTQMGSSEQAREAEKNELARVGLDNEVYVYRLSEDKKFYRRCASSEWVPRAITDGK